MTSQPRSLIRHWLPRDFPMRFYNGVFQLMTKIRSVENNCHVHVVLV